MNILQVVHKNIIQNSLSSFLGVLLSAFGTAIFCLLLLLSSQVSKQLDANSKHIDLVVGAKGSPLQLILNSIYHVDYPTGNIPLEEVQKLSRNPLVKLAVPLSMGDNYHGYRIIGTDSSFLELYGAAIETGKWWTRDFEAVVGAHAAQKEHLKIGDKIIGAHGLSNSSDLHADHPYTVTGILKENNSVADKLILTGLSSVWRMHDGHHHYHHDESGATEVHSLIASDHQIKEITSMLILYKSPTAIAMFPRIVNQTTAMQAASPAIEGARLFSILGIGLDALLYLAYTLMLIAAISVFISLYTSFKSRKYELAIMRTMGGSRNILFGIMIIEGVYITLIGSGIGISIAHLVLYFISRLGNSGMVSAWGFARQEGWIPLIGLFLGFVAALIPAIKAYLTPISKTLSN